MRPDYVLAGLLIGFLIGLTGMGGGALMTPVLIFLLGVKPTIAVGSDLAYAAVTKMVGAVQHHRQRTVDYALAWRLAIGSVPGSLIGVVCVHELQRRFGSGAQQLLLRPLGLMLILIAIALFAQAGIYASGCGGLPKLQPRLPARCPWAVAAGLVLGFLVGITSVGSGTLFGVLLAVAFGLSPRERVGTDVYHGALLTAAAAAAHVWAGNVDYSLVGVLLLGSVPGVLIGARVATKMPDKALRPVLAGVLLLSGVKMI